MERPIRGYDRDEEGHWVARLSCGHGHHLRHQPPFHDRAWVEDLEERTRRLGHLLACPACDRAEIPAGAVAYRRTPVFTEETVPAGLLKDHTTKAGVWGLLHVSSGELEYRVGARRTTVTPSQPAVIVPEVEHCVRPIGPVRFEVEFLRREPA